MISGPRKPPCSPLLVWQSAERQTREEVGSKFYANDPPKAAEQIAEQIAKLETLASQLFECVCSCIVSGLASR